MNWLDLIAGGLLALSLAGMVFLGIALRRAVAADRKRRFDEAYEEGFDAGMIIGGVHIARIEGIEIHGFGRRCPDCRALNGALQHPSREYWKCSKCGARHPSPLDRSHYAVK